MPATVLQFKPRENDEVSDSGQYLGTMPTVADVDAIRASGEAVLNQILAQRPEMTHVIVGKLRFDVSEPVTDYHNHRTVKTIVLAFSANSRDNFKEMRKAAGNAPETQFLVDAPKSAENREKYSMGAGYYLATESHSGWEVRKWEINWKRNELCEILSEPDALRAPVKTSQTSEPLSAGKKAWATRQARKAAAK